jgi:hypothetical protein
MRVLGVVIGLAAGVLWIIFGVFHIVGSRVMVAIFPVVVQSLAVGLAVVVTSLIAFRWHMVGGVLLLLEGVTPIVLLFLMAAGYPLFFSVISGLTIVSGLLFLFSGAKS